jgi:hypothetical protein
MLNNKHLLLIQTIIQTEIEPLLDCLNLGNSTLENVSTQASKRKYKKLIIELLFNTCLEGKFNRNIWHIIGENFPAANGLGLTQFCEILDTHTTSSTSPGNDAALYNNYMLRLYLFKSILDHNIITHPNNEIKTEIDNSIIHLQILEHLNKIYADYLQPKINLPLNQATPASNALVSRKSACFNWPTQLSRGSIGLLAGKILFVLAAAGTLWHFNDRITPNHRENHHYINYMANLNIMIMALVLLTALNQLIKKLYRLYNSQQPLALQVGAATFFTPPTFLLPSPAEVLGEHFAEKSLLLKQ